MLFLIIAMAVLLTVTVIVGWFFLGYDAEKWAERRHRHLTPGQARVEALENHPSNEDGSERFD